MRIGAFLVVSSLLSGIGFGEALPESPDFDSEIRPILAEKCFQCHGPDAESRKADLRLDTKEGAFGNLGGYQAVVPGDSSNSELAIRIMDQDADSVMPPPGFQHQLSEAEKQLLIRWIDSGANWKQHWAFEPISKPAVSDEPNSWRKNPIDYFIQKKHFEQGLDTNPPADRYALARRASLDIIGLPPTPSELEDFVRNSDPDAYLHYIDKLLDSKHYGEHRARFWLDAARYSDTHGLHLDNFREMWPYRDWVIEAFNRNLPFDQFTIEQIAGDLLDSPSKSQLIATGFVRNNASSSEAGSIPEELRVRYMTDRTETVATTFLGLSAGCAACHDHKFDPISQKEFYQLGAFFNNSVDPPMDGNMRDTYPVVVVPSAENETEWNSLQRFRDEISFHLSHPDLDKIKVWWANGGRLETGKFPNRDVAVYAPFEKISGEKTIVTIKGKTHEVELKGARAAANHPHGERGIQFEATGGIDLPVGILFQPNKPVTISMWIKTPADVKGLKLMNQWGEENEETGLKKTGWNLELIPDGAFEMPLRDNEGTLCNTLMPSETPLKPNTWQHVAIRYSGGQAASSISYYIDGEWRVGRRNWDTHITDRFGDHLSEIMTLGSDAVGGCISDFRIYTRWLLDGELKLLADEFAWKTLIGKKPKWEELTTDELSLVQRYFQFYVDKGTSKLAHLLGESQTRSDYLYARSPTTLVMQEKNSPPKAHILARGAYDQPGEVVSANTPAVLPPLQAKDSANRLDLARWLVSGNNPLTARVTVNRVWQSIFGTGIVKTSGDFGIMGEKPTHPELLDWLAAEFQNSGWDLKHLIRLIVTSSTYQQSSKVTTANFAIDPENRHLARGARRRLDAEVLRDQALAVSGLLDPTFGGPSVKPYQPAGVWKAVAFQVSNTNEFKLDSINNLHRRSVYTFWKRTAIPPAFAAFDAPSREECSVRRERTNTPLQALVLMNDEQHVEAARVLSESLLTEFPGANDTTLALQAFTKVLGRPPKVADLMDLTSLADWVSKEYQKAPEEAETFISVGELPNRESLDPIRVAAWTVVINALLNRDDVLNQS
ncbi:MAG: DUF1553 domain-containing protein [Verrucomicrobiales bacterium]|nr:DUF1553 domain-containing protein [Verrucomicrobiales bacterium]